MEPVYVVIQKGVYRHDITGVYTDIKKAEEGAISSIKEEKDAYHEYEVVECFLDPSKPTQGEVVFTVSRKWEGQTYKYMYK